MNWDDVKLFLAVSRQTRLDEAAALLNIDATTISRRIKRLEKDLGRTLFERTRRGHSLTPAGEQLATLAEKMEAASLDIQVKAEGEEVTAGRVRLGVPEGLGTNIIAPSLKNFNAAYPLIELDLIALSGFVSVPKRQADMSILLTRPTSGRIKVVKFSEYHLHLYAAQPYLDQRPDIFDRASLKEHVLIGYTDDLIYSSQLKYLEDVLPSLTPHLCSPSINAQMEMIAAGAGIGILPDFMARRNKSLTKILSHEVEVKRTLWLAVHSDIADLMRIRVVIDFLMELKNTLE